MQAVVRFWKVRDELAKNQSEGVTRLATVARAQALATHRKILNDQAMLGLKQIGETNVTPTTAAPTGTDGVYVVTACLDVSKVNVVDAAGKSQVRPGRPDKTARDYKVQRDGANWYVVEDISQGKPC